MNKKTIYEIVTEKISSNLQSAGSWQKLWDTPVPISLQGHIYSGINHLLLSTTMYSSSVWGTFNQVRSNGGVVNKGESATLVVFWKRMVEKQLNDKTGKYEEIIRYMLRYYNVFNTDQCRFDDLGVDKISSLNKESGQKKNNLHLSAENIILNYPDKPLVETGANQRACYIPSLDKVMVPDIGYFTDSWSYYSVMFHELIHSTGHPKRLNRFTYEHRFADENYSREELIAELGASFLSTIAGIDHNIDNSAAYIKGWLKQLKENPTWITWAASRAQKACEHIIPSLQGKTVGEESLAA